MSEKIELLGGALRFTPVWLFLDCLTLLHFALSWIYSVRKTGWKIDFLHITLLQSFVVTVLLLYPLNASFQNMHTIGTQAFLRADAYIDQAFAIILLGYVGLWLGVYLVASAEIGRLFDRFFSFFRFLELSLAKNILHKKSIHSLFITCLVLTALITALSTCNGFFLRPRAFFQMHGHLRPIYNFTISLAPFLLTALSLRFLQLKEKWCKILLTIAFAMCIFYGVRSVLIHALLFYYVFSIFKNQGRFNIARILIGLPMLILLALELEKIREGMPIFYFSSNIFEALAYGNHFSDTRDFAWVLANWDQEYLLGLGYLANIMSFIPSTLLPFRQEYSLANYVSKLIDLDISIHNGVRPGFFGQVFFNFGVFGVFISGIICGIALKITDLKLKECILKRQNIIEAYGKTIPYFCVTTILFAHIYWNFYLFILINLLLAFFRRFSFHRYPQSG